MIEFYLDLVLTINSKYYTLNAQDGDLKDGRAVGTKLVLAS